MEEKNLIKNVNDLLGIKYIKNEYLSLLVTTFSLLISLIIWVFTSLLVFNDSMIIPLFIYVVVMLIVIHLFEEKLYKNQTDSITFKLCNYYLLIVFPIILTDLNYGLDKLIKKEQSISIDDSFTIEQKELSIETYLELNQNMNYVKTMSKINTILSSEKYKNSSVEMKEEIQLESDKLIEKSLIEFYSMREDIVLRFNYLDLLKLEKGSYYYRYLKEFKNKKGNITLSIKLSDEFNVSLEGIDNLLNEKVMELEKVNQVTTLTDLLRKMTETRGINVNEI